jgi:DNA-binding transcriptional regulator YdaS (Cro superfamily)
MSAATLYSSLDGVGILPAELARCLGVDKGTVSKWNRGLIPAERIVEIERITGIPREKLRPDLFKRPKPRTPQ